MVDMLCEIDLTYRSKVQYTRDGKRKFLYGKLAKAVYGTLMGVYYFIISCQNNSQIGVLK